MVFATDGTVNTYPVATGHIDIALLGVIGPGVAGTPVYTVMVMGLLVAVAGEVQVALEVIITEITEPDARDVVV